MSRSRGSSVSRAVRLGGAVAAGFGLLALLGWALRFPLLASLGSDRIPMAPSTALLFILYGSATVLCGRLPLGRGALLACVTIASAGAGIAFLLLVLSFAGIHPAVELLGFAPAGTVGNAPVGYMSPVAASCFLVASLSFLGSLPSTAHRPWRAAVARGTAILLLAASAVLLLAYLFGSPLFYSGSFIPPAATTSIAFAALGAALLALARRQSRRAGGTPAPLARVPRSLALVFVLLAAGIVGLGGLYFRSDARRYRAETEHQLSAVAELEASELAQWRAERLGDASVFLNNAAFVTLVRRLFDDPQDAEAREDLRGWMAKVQAIGSYDRLSLLDSRGVERLVVPEGQAPRSAVIARRVPEVLQSEEAIFEDFYRNEHDQRVYLNVLVPILDGRGPTLGVLSLRIDPETYLYPFLQRWPTAARTAETLLVRREGNDALFLNKLKFEQHGALTLRIPLANREVTGVQAVLGREGIVEARDYRGVAVIAALRAVPGSPWFLVARIDSAEANAPLRQRLWVMIFLVGGMLAAAAASVGVVWREQRVRDLRERYAVEQERAWLHNVVARSLNEIYMFDPETLRFRFANRGACRNIGYTQEELTELTPLELKPELTPENFRDLLAPLGTAERPVHAFETVHRRKNGSEYPVEVHLQLVDSGAGAVFLAVVNDITERRRAETRIRSLNRVYAVLSDVNQAIVRVRDPLALFAEACRIAVETGGFRMAWVGLLDGPTNSVRPVAHAGLTDGYIEKLEIALGEADGARGLGPTASALREGVHAVSNDIEHDPCMAPWRDDALALGYRASAAFPLTVNGKTLGTFNLYASEPGFFDEEELRLLDEMAMDLAFAMETSRLEGVGRRLATAIEQAPVSVVITDSDGRIEYVNPAFTSITGYAPGEALGSTPRMLKSGKQEPELYRELWATIRAGKSWHGELVNRRKDGSFYVQEQTIAPVHDTAGRVTHFVAISQDVTERERTEEALRNAEALYRGLFEQSPDGILLIDAEIGTILEANEVAHQQLGYTREEFGALRISDFEALETAEETQRHIVKVIAEGSDNFETLHRAKSGAIRNVHVWTRRIQLGERIAFHCIFEDITERKMADEALQEAENRLRTIVEGTKALLVGVDADGHFTFANEATAAAAGLASSSELIGKPYLHFVHPEDRQRVFDTFLSQANTHQPASTQEFRLVDTKGTVKWFSFLSSLEIKDGRVVGQSGVGRDVTEHKRAEEELRESESRLRRIVDNIHDALYVDDLDGRVTFANDQFLALFGFERTQLSHLELEDYVAPEWRTALRDRHERRMRGEAEPRHFEYEGLGPNGRRLWLESSVVPLFDGNGRIIGTQSADRDITERKRAEASLQASEERFRTVYESAAVGLYRTTPDGRVLMANPAAVRMLGYDSFDELARRDLESEGFEPSYTRREFRDRLQRDGIAVGIESEWIRRDGTRIFVRESARLFRDESGAPLYYDGSFEDVTPHKKAEEAILKEKAFSEALLDSLPGIFYLFDSAGHFLRWNHALETVSGYSATEVAAMQPLDLITAEDRGSVAETIQRVFELGAADVEAELAVKDGRRLPFYFTGARFLVDGVPCCIGMGIDLTARKLLEAELRQAQKIEAIGRLAGGVAHDFNNLLGVILGYGEMAESELPPGNPAREQVMEMVKAANRAATLTRQLQAFSRNQVLQPKLLDLNTLVASMQKMLGRLIGEDVVLLVRPAPDLGTVRADPGQVDQILLNLAVNARDAMPSGGTLSIETANVVLEAETATDHLPVKPGRYVRLAVSDTGLGMDAETQARAFEPFFTTKPAGQGTGLGLAMVYGIVKQSGGYIWVYSELGQGTTFKIYLPRVDEPTDVHPTSPPAEEIPVGHETVLLVEDNAALREVVRLRLEGSGYTVLQAEDGEQAMALAAARTEPIDLLLTDVVMPKLGGGELARRLGALRPGLRVLYISGYTDGAIQQHGVLEEGAILLAKPFTGDQLSRAVCDALNRSRPD